MLANRTLDETALLRLGLATKLGGAGVQWASSRRHAAFWAGWTALAPDVRDDLGVTTLADLLEKLPGARAQLQAAREGLARQGAPAAEGHRRSWRPRQTARLSESGTKKRHAALKQHLFTDGKAWLEGAGGPGAGAFLQYPEDACCAMEDELWSTALRLRLGLDRAEYNQQQLPLAANTPTNRRAHGTTCGEVLDTQGKHSSTCKTGGGVIRRHSHLEKAVGGLLKPWTGQEPLFEQRVPSWDRPRRSRQTNEDPVERAVLDIEYTDGSVRLWIDVTTRHPAAGTPADAAAVLPPRTVTTRTV